MYESEELYMIVDKIKCPVCGQEVEVNPLNICSVCGSKLSDTPKKKTMAELKQVMMDGLTPEQLIAFKGLSRAGINFIDMNETWVVSKAVPGSSSRTQCTFADLKAGDTVVLQKGDINSRQGIVLKNVTDVLFDEKTGLVVIDADNRLLTSADKNLVHEAAMNIQRICATAEYYIQQLNNEYMRESYANNSPSVKFVGNASDFEKNTIMAVAFDTTMSDVHGYVRNGQEIEFGAPELEELEFDNPFAKIDTFGRGFDDKHFGFGDRE